MAAATYAQDTPANQAAIDQYLSSLAAWAIKQRAVNQEFAALLESYFNSAPEGVTIANLLTGYTAGSTIPNKTNYAGATQVTKEGLQTVTGYLQTALSLNDAAHVDAMLALCGAANL